MLFKLINYLENVLRYLQAVDFQVLKVFRERCRSLLLYRSVA